MKPIAMKCSQENWEEIKPILEKHKLEYIGIFDFSIYSYLVNNTDNKLGLISNSIWKSVYNRTVFEEWNKEIFLEYCGIKEEKPKLFTIQDLAEGKCAVINDGIKEELNKVLKLAFPRDRIPVTGSHIFYIKNNSYNQEWEAVNKTNLPT